MTRVYFDEEEEYLRSLEEERIELVGPICEYYSLNRGHNVPIETSCSPISMYGYVSLRLSGSRINASQTTFDFDFFASFWIFTSPR